MTKNYRTRKAKELLEKRLSGFSKHYKVPKPHLDRLIDEIFEVFDSREFKTLIIETKKYEKIRQAKIDKKKGAIGVVPESN